MIIDAHNHPDWHNHNADKHVENMEKYGIDKTFILSWIAPRDEYDPEANHCYNVSGVDGEGPLRFEGCLKYVSKYPDRFILGYAPDPRRPDAIDALAAAISLYGVKIYGEIKLRMMYDNPDAIRMFRFCGERGLPVTVHIDYEFDSGRKYPRPNYWYGGGIGAFERAVAACPDTIFLGHAPGFWAHISGDDQYDKAAYPAGPVLPGGRVIEMLEKYKNLYCDISAGSGLNALTRDPQFGKRFLIEYQDRILYARDYFDNKHQEFIDSLGLDEAVRDKIYYKNALKVINQ